MPGAISRLVSLLALAVASAALAQQGPGRPGPGQGIRRDRPLVDIRNDFVEESRRSARDLADQLSLLTPAHRAEAYLASSERHRAQAFAMVHLARCGAAFPNGAAGRIREALRFDLHTWREGFQVGEGEWRSMRDHWLVERRALTAAEWAERRAAWFRERDAWIARRPEWAGVLPPEARPTPAAASDCGALA